jgi:hypothetical protein
LENDSEEGEGNPIGVVVENEITNSHSTSWRSDSRQ